MRAIVRAFATFTADPIVNGFYLWYVFVLLIVYCWYPLLRLVCVDDSVAGKARLYLLVLGFLATIASMTLFALYPSLRDTFRIPNPLHIYTIFYVVLGY